MTQFPNIARAKVNWYHGYANSPTLEVYVDGEMPPQDCFVYEAFPRGDEPNKNVMLVSRNNYPWVRFVYIEDPSYDAIRGGALGGNYKLTDGSELKSRSGWSSRASVINRDYAPNPDDEIIEVTVNTPRGSRWAGYSLNMEWFLNTVGMPRDIYLVQEVDSRGEIRWTPSIVDYEVRKPERW